MDTKGLQKEFINWCKANKKSPKSEQETKQLFVSFMKEKHPEEYKAAVENQKKQQQQQAQKAAHGAKLNYFKSLKNQCAEDEEVVYYKKGGSVTCGCKKKEDGGQVSKASIGGIVERFKNRTKQKVEEAKKLADKKEADKAFKEHRMIPGKHLPRGNNNVTEAERNDVTRDLKGSKIKKNCGGAAVKAFKAAKCGSKLKKHLQGGSLNRIPFIKKVL